jgi:hypothetical protein
MIDCTTSSAVTTPSRTTKYAVPKAIPALASREMTANDSEMRWRLLPMRGSTPN